MKSVQAVCTDVIEIYTIMILVRLLVVNLLIISLVKNSWLVGQNYCTTKSNIQKIYTLF